ncbi:MAG: anti-sigma factor [Gammaproteobacteria bacterium]|nr:anti-sigma factor [Gammaproteobacteria bacterium]
MNYGSDELRNLLAGKYVLGQLRGRARFRFERLLLARPDFVRAVAEWEERLAPLARAATPVMPPARAWRRIARGIRAGRASKPALFAWKPWAVTGFMTAGVAAVAFFVMLGLYLSRPAPVAAPSEVAVIATEQGAPRWVITVRGERIHMQAVGVVKPPPGKSYELWMLPGGGAEPVSLGLLPASGAAGESLSGDMLHALESAKGLAVSVEPAGGSPTGLPTGPVVYTTKIASI